MFKVRNWHKKCVKRDTISCIDFRNALQTSDFVLTGFTSYLQSDEFQSPFTHSQMFWKLICRNCIFAEK